MSRGRKAWDPDASGLCIAVLILVLVALSPVVMRWSL